MTNDYFLVAALPALYLGTGLLQSTVGTLYVSRTDLASARGYLAHPASAVPRLTAAIELLWLSIYCVKACFLAQFKFNEPPYAYVSTHLTRYYWALIGICTTAYLFTFVQPIILCPDTSMLLSFKIVSPTDPRQRDVGTSSPRVLYPGRWVSLPLILRQTCLVSTTLSVGEVRLT